MDANRASARRLPLGLELQTRPAGKVGKLYIDHCPHTFRVGDLSGGCGRAATAISGGRCCRFPLEESLTFLGDRNWAQPPTGQWRRVHRHAPTRGGVRSICRRGSELTTPRDWHATRQVPYDRRQGSVDNLFESEPAPVQFTSG